MSQLSELLEQIEHTHDKLNLALQDSIELDKKIATYQVQLNGLYDVATRLFDQIHGETQEAKNIVSVEEIDKILKELK